MDFGTVPSVTVSIFDILLSGAETLSERRVLETGHGCGGSGRRWGRVRGRVAYVVAVIGQEKTRDQVSRRVALVEVVPPLDSTGRKIDGDVSCGLPAVLSPSHDA
jgi:hypothetical protein